MFSSVKLPTRIVMTFIYKEKEKTHGWRQACHADGRSCRPGWLSPNLPLRLSSTQQGDWNLTQKMRCEKYTKLDRCPLSLILGCYSLAVSSVSIYVNLCKTHRMWWAASETIL